MKKILILFAHPALQKSRVNKILIEDINMVEGVTFHDLYQTYPDMAIDVSYEQWLLESHDIIAFQFPCFWYSTPSLLKEWQDMVLQHGWAFGREGNTLKDKLFFVIITTGGSQKSFHKNGHNHYTIEEFLIPLKQTATICKMIFLPPYVVHGTYSISLEDIYLHKGNLFKLLSLLRDEEINIKKTQKLPSLNSILG